MLDLNLGRHALTLSMSALWRRLRGTDSDPCLYFFPFAILSIIVRFTVVLALHGKSRPSRDLARLRYQLVNLHRNENLTENYLLHINPHGGVPALTAKSLESPLTDSLSITYWICERCPSLLPETHRTTICCLLSQLHNTLENHNPNPEVEDLLARGDLTPAHRRALEYKRECQRKGRELKFTSDHGHSMTDQTRSLLRDVLQQYRNFNRGGTWIFGDDVGPTVLDAQIAAFILRLIDLDLVELVPPELVAYAEAIMKLPVWHEVMKGRPTVWDKFLGPVEELDV